MEIQPVDHLVSAVLTGDRGRVEVLEAGADIGASAASGPHTGESPAASALSQGHLVLASDLDPDRPDA